jgi:hypothetical protein
MMSTGAILARSAQTLACFLIALTLGLGFSGVAQAQTGPQPALNDAAKAMVDGTWEFSNADRDKRCTVTFRTNPSTSGMKLEFDRDCATQFPFIKEIAGWTLTDNDFLRLLDAKGKSVLEFSEVETGMYEAPRPGEGILFIQTVAAIGPPPKEASALVGDWVVMRSDGRRVCTLTLVNAAAGQDLALRIKPGCDAFVTRFAPTAWQMDRGELLLKNARNQTWRFAEGEDAVWQRVPEGAEPIMLTRP